MTTKSPPASGSRVPELDGLRGIAILLVLVYHFTPTTGPLTILDHPFQFGWIGVDVFFVLSGYLITGILLDSVGRPFYYRNFIVRRTLRIFPLYYACLVLSCILTYYPGTIHWKDFLTKDGGWWYAFYLGNIRASIDGHWPAVGFLIPLWSLQVEEQFYLTYPLLVASVSRKTLAKILVAAVGTAFLLRVVITFTVPNSLVWTYTFMPCRMDPLALGGLIAIAQRDWPQLLQKRWLGWVTGISAVTFFTEYMYSRGSLWTPGMRTFGYSALDFACAGLLVMVVAWRKPGLIRVFRWKWLVWIGTISYGLYLLHLPAAAIVRRFTPKLGVSMLGSADFVFCIAAAILAAWISWWVFESRILKLKDRFTVR